MYGDNLPFRREKDTPRRTLDLRGCPTRGWVSSLPAPPYHPRPVCAAAAHFPAPAAHPRMNGKDGSMLSGLARLSWPSRPDFPRGVPIVQGVPAHRRAQDRDHVPAAGHVAEPGRAVLAGHRAPRAPRAGSLPGQPGPARQAPAAAVTSHELLSACDAGQAGRGVGGLQPAEVHVVLTVRDMATLLP